MAGVGVLPLTATLSSGTRIIILTVVLSAAAALIAPVGQADAQGKTKKEGSTDVA